MVKKEEKLKANGPGGLSEIIILLIDEETLSYMSRGLRAGARDLQPHRPELKARGFIYFPALFSHAASLFLYNDSRVCCIKAGLGLE